MRHFLISMVILFVVSNARSEGRTFPTKDSVTVIVGTLKPTDAKEQGVKEGRVRYWDIQNPKIMPSKLVQVKIKYRDDAWIDPSAKVLEGTVMVGYGAIRIVEWPDMNNLAGYEYIVLVYE